MLRCIYISFLFFFLLLFNSCKKQNLCDCFKTRGDVTIESRSVSDFATIHVFDKIDVYFTQDTTVTTGTVKVVTGKNLLSNIITEVSGGVLQIKNENKCNFVRGSNNGVTVYVTAPRVKIFKQEGVGNMYCTNTVYGDTIHGYIINSGDLHLKVNTNRVVGHMHGAGDLYLEGVALDFYTHTIGQGFVHAQNMTTTYAFINDGTNGQIRVNVTGQLDAVIASTGNLYYSGNPAVINSTIKGTGKLIRE